MEAKQNKIVVLGSASQDYFFKIDRIPQIGETIDCRGFEKSFGGKGANQAITVGKLGAPVEMLLQLGDDQPGRGYVEHFKKFGVETKNIKLLKDEDTGQAYILALKDGNNSIIINGASNSAYDPEMKELDPAWAEAVRNSKILLLQREIPEYVNIVAARTAKQAGTLVILDAGGRDEPLSKELLENLDIISPNETELERVIGKKVENHEQAKEEIHALIKTHPTLKVLLKRGEFGSTIFYNDTETNTIKEVHKDAYDFKDFPNLKLVDTTGAGDCFTGAFAVKMLEGTPYDKALEFANQVGFLCITKFGAGPSIPTLSEVQQVFGKQ